MQKNYTEAKQSHIDFFKAYMDRVSLNLGTGSTEQLPTDKRVEKFKTTHDAGLLATYFQFGRYLLICSSQPGGQPANLQGIWNDKLFPFNPSCHEDTPESVTHSPSVSTNAS